MSGIVEQVAKSTFHAECAPHMAETGYGTRFAWDDAMPQVQKRHEAIARAAIHATLEYARDNVSDGMLEAGYGHRYRLDTSLGKEQATLSARAMLIALLAELDRPPETPTDAFKRTLDENMARASDGTSKAADWIAECVDRAELDGTESEGR